MEELEKPIAQRYTEGRYGGKEYVIKFQQKKDETYEQCCERFYRERTGSGEYRNPYELFGKELLTYTPPLKKKKNENNINYAIRQLDYWLDHTVHTRVFKKNPFSVEGLFWYDKKRDIQERIEEFKETLKKRGITGEKSVI